MTTIFDGWLWFKVDTWPKFAGVIIFQLFLSVNTVSVQYASMISLTTHMKYLCAQCDMLIVFIKEAFEPNLGDEHNLSEHQRCVNREKLISIRINNIIEQHHQLLSLFGLFQELYNPFLLTMAFASGLLICTLIYIITDPNSTSILIMQCSSLLTVELTFVSCYCWVGQQITDKWGEVRYTFYEIPWYDQPISIQKSLLNILTGSTRDQLLMAGGIQEFSMKGYSELLQAAFSYFNMLKAIR